MAFSLPQRLKRLKPKSRGGPGRLLESLAVRQPVVYRSVVTLFALAGFLLLALFPLVALVILAGLPQQIQAIGNWQEGLSLGVNLLIVIIAGALSVPLVKIRFTPPQGMAINQQNAPELWQQVQELRGEYNYPAIDNIILREGFSVEAIRTPRFNLPFLFRNTLCIGLETLLTLPPDQFKSLLARRVGQFSRIHHRYISWLADLRKIWPQYYQAFKHSPGPLSLPLQFMFALYSSLYTRLSFFVERENELEADRYALDISNDDELSGLFSQLIVTSNFLKTKFWPKITQLAQRGGKPEHLPYKNIGQVLRRGLTREDMQNWLKTAFEMTSDNNNPAPLFQQRLENIGHHKPMPPRPLNETAADRYVDEAVMQKIIDKFDQRWLAMLSK